MAVNLFPGSWNGSVSLSFGTALQSTWGWVNSQRQEAMVAYGYYIPNWSTWLAPKWQDWIPTMIVTHLPWATLPGFSSRALSGLLPTHGQPLQWSSRRCLFPTWTSQQKLFGTLWRSFEQCPGPSFSRLGGISHFERLIGRFVGFVCLASRIAKFAGMMIVMRLWMLITRRGGRECYHMLLLASIKWASEDSGGLRATGHRGACRRHPGLAAAAEQGEALPKLRAPSSASRSRCKSWKSLRAKSLRGSKRI